jgi:hypothetical protein
MSQRKALTDLQAREDRARAALTKKHQALAVAQAQLKAAETRARQRQCVVIGKLALEAGLHTLPLEHLREAFTTLARYARDEGTFAAWLREHADPSAPRFEPCALPSMSATYPAKAHNGTGE